MKKMQTIIMHQKPTRSPAQRVRVGKEEQRSGMQFEGGPKRDRLQTEWSGFHSDVSCVDKKDAGLCPLHHNGFQRFCNVQKKTKVFEALSKNCPKHLRQFSFYSILFSNISAILYIVLTQLCNISYPCQTNGFSSWIPKS